jgi:hypothetical protein
MVTDNLTAMKNMYIRLGFFIGLFSFGFISCDDLVDPIVSDLEFDRQFTPTRITTTNGQTQATIQWSASLFSETGAVTYKVEVSKTLAFTVIEYSTTTSELQAVVTNQSIEIKQEHFARVKALGATETEDSGWIVSGAFQITGEQIFSNVTEADLTHSSVTLKWVSGGNVTSITLTPDNGAPTEYPITDEEKTANVKTITGLTQGTNYTAEIFDGGTSRGVTTFTTFSLEVPEAELIVVLEDDKLIEEQIDFSTVSVSSVTVVFEQGKVYNSGATMVLTTNNVNIHFYGMPGPDKPIVSFSLLTLPALGGEIKFSNLDLTGYPNGDPTATKRAYIFNQSAATQTSEIVFENCIIRNFENTPVRIQGGNAIDINNLVVNNCIVYDVSTGGQNYAFINNTATNGRVNNIEITNSTFYHLKIGLILHNATPSQSLKISDCTVDDICIDGRALVDYNAQTVGTFTFTANILGKTKGTSTVRGIRIASASVTVPSSSFITADYIVANNPIGGVTTYAGLSTDLFQNTATGDFNFKDTNFAGKSTAGDPRWRQ